MYSSESKELIVIGMAMLFFLALSITAVVIFVRQWRKERGSDSDRRDR